MVQKQEQDKILLHACCGVCSGYPIALLKEIGYTPVVFFCNPNLCSEEEFNKRLEAQSTVCNYHNVELIIDEYCHEEFLNIAKGLELLPEKSLRCDKCIELRLRKTVAMAKKIGISKFTTSLVISPHKNFNKISELGISLADGLEYIAIDFKKKDGFLKTNNLSKELNLYRQNFCGCEYTKG